MVMPDLSIEAKLGAALRARGWTFAAAESCTGGLVAHRMTNIAGSSIYVLGGVVAYANAIKEGVLGVRSETLAAHGAVSEATAREMVAGVLRLFATDTAVAITGIAGPGGGTPDKPVGLTYIAAALRDGETRVERHVWPGDREAVKSASAERAMSLLLDVLNTA
jgi:PncC family amidohydrolase